MEPKCVENRTPIRDTQEGGNHYKHMKIQPMEFSHANELDCYQHTVIKYVCRHADKGGELDINKAIHCLQMYKEAVYGDVK